MTKHVGTSNLIPTNRRSKDEVKRNSAKGGIASGEARRKNKSIREALQVALSGRYVVDGEVVDGYEALALAQLNKAFTGDTAAAAFVRDSSGEKPTDKLNLGSGDNDLTKINITFADKSNRDNYTEKDPIIVDGGALKNDTDGT